MELIRGLHNVRTQHKACVTTIGNFDGVHQGHQVIVKQVQRLAKALAVPSSVIIFEPQPREYFDRQSAPARLTPLREKLRLLAKLGVDQVLCLPFNAKLQQWSAREFTQNVLVDGLSVKQLVVGDDFRFGRDRQGNFQFLQKFGTSAGFSVEDTETVFNGDQRISSTRIREQLALGEFSQAAQLLGRYYCTFGRVTYGQQIGRTIDTPTANISLNQWNFPLEGVFCVGVKNLLTNRFYHGVANVGQRPTVNGLDRRLEVHLFDFSGDLYHQKLGVVFLRQLRAVEKFDSVSQLKKQIEQDKQKARDFFTGLDSTISYFDA